MGQNAYFAFGIVLGMGHTWQSALGAVFFSGIIFITLSVLPVREWLINAIPRSLKLGISAGIGFFLAIIALAGIRTKLRYSNIPPGLRGLGITFILTGLMALGFQCFSSVSLQVP